VIRRIIKVEADGVDLKVTIEGTAPPGIIRAIGGAVQATAFDYISNVNITTSIPAYEVEEEDEEDEGLAPHPFLRTRDVTDPNCQWRWGEGKVCGHPLGHKIHEGQQ
jgi:hypothetical protein